MSLGMLASQVAAKAVSAETVVHKWHVFHDIREARDVLGVSDRALAILNALLSFHPEASEHPHRTVQLIRAHGMKAGLALNPGTPLAVLDHLLDELDLVLLMSVNPGFGGQAFIEGVLPKIEAARRRIEASGRPVWLEVDGGVNARNVGRIVAAGANTLVAGSAVFGAGDYRRAISALREGAAVAEGMA